MTNLTNVNNEVGEKLKHALILGDLSRLSPQEKVQYYNKTCESLGLNPLTKPFAYIRLQGKETLYATKNATDQLRKVYGVSIVDCDQKIQGELLLVTVKAQDRNGKTDVDVGALPVGHLKGDSLANAIMKTVTKAKRRVTLSICGLGMLDETELETIPVKNIQKPIPYEADTTVLDNKHVDVSNWPEDLRQMYTDHPILKTDFENGPDHLIMTKKFRDSRLRDIDIEELGNYFTQYMQISFAKNGGGFSHPIKQRDYEAIKDYLEHYKTYQEIMEEQGAE